MLENGEKSGKSAPEGGKKARLKEGVFLVILGDNPTGHCFVSLDLNRTNFFQKVMIVKLKLRTARKFFGKTCLK